MERCPMQRSAQPNSGSFNLAYKQNWIMSMLGKLRGVLLNIFHQSDCSDALKTLHENKHTPPFLSYTTTLQLSPHSTSRLHLWMLYGLSPPAKRKYSNLKLLVGWQIVKRNKKTSIAGVTSGRRTTATQGDFKEGPVNRPE